MEATVEKIEKLFDRFNVWDLLGENYWAMLLADRPEYAKQKQLKIKSVAYNPLIVMESNKHIYLKKLENEKRMGNFPLTDEYKRRLEVDNYPEALYIYKYIDGILLFTSREWMIILSRAPNLFEFAVSKGALNVLDDYSKSFILHKQPSLGDRICVKKKFEFTISHAKEKNSLEIEFDKKLIDEKQRAIEDINTKILNNEDSLIQITPKMWSLAIESNPAISDYCEKYSTANGDKKTGITTMNSSRSSTFSKPRGWTNCSSTCVTTGADMSFRAPCWLLLWPGPPIRARYTCARYTMPNVWLRRPNRRPIGSVLRGPVTMPTTRLPRRSTPRWAWSGYMSSARRVRPRPASC